MRRSILIIFMIALAGCAADPAPGGAATGSPDGTGSSDVTGSPDVGGGAVDTAGKPTTPISAAITVVTLGDSLTEGIGDSEWTDDGVAVGFPGRLEARLSARGADAKVENLGRSGWTSGDLINGIDWGDGPEPSELSLALPLLEGAVKGGRSAVATVWIGSNDLFGLYDWCHEPDNAQCEADNLAEYTANLDAALGKLAGTGATVLVALLDDQSKRPVLTDPKYADSFPNIGPADRALMAAQIVKYNDVVKNLATKHGATTVDFYHTTLFEQPATLDDDGNHPNAAGYEAVTTIWETAVGAALGL